MAWQYETWVSPGNILSVYYALQGEGDGAGIYNSYDVQMLETITMQVDSKNKNEDERGGLWGM